MQKKLTPRINV